MGRRLPGGTFVEPLYPIKMWNHHHQVPQGIPRTTNAVEAWHRSYNSTIGCHHPNIWKFIVALKREQGLVEVKQSKLLSGEKPTKRVKNKANEEALKTLILSYFHRTPLEFLKGVAHRFYMESILFNSQINNLSILILHFISLYCCVLVILKLNINM